ncbi:hypothetical protein [Desulfovibrio ferrophilus]|uniref:Putative lipoprotein n=1 Tax=Desulfovibrio ferrophilus TaxID=241368 RepID=A0A2Z6B0Q3_9BACT|nr:hypothetical protein [Desulfovibrio ferrophilus]BBD09089.1 putative lipoprotein [Desulfovibrio ferrophilus]
MKRLIACLAIIISLTALWGCSSTNVKHLARQPWTLDANQSLAMKFWRFDYRIVPTNDQFSVCGSALPLSDAIPAWANQVADIWFAAYLSDASGKVIAQDLRVFEPGSLDRDSGIGFEFRLKPETLPTRNELFITFGYRMKLTGDRGKNEVFFASEGAMTRF